MSYAVENSNLHVASIPPITLADQLTMIFDNKYLMARLIAVPEFSIRLEELVAWHGLAERLALIIQARPTLEFPRSVDLKDFELVQRFQNGRPDQENWWDDFRSTVRPTQTFHGIAER